MTDRIKVLIADDHVAVRRSIRALLETQPDFEVVGVAADGREAVDLAERLSPDVVVMDITMPQVDGLAAAEEIQAHQPRVQIVILSMHASRMLVQTALRKGALGYVPKRRATAELPAAIRKVFNGQPYLSALVQS